MSLTIRGIFNDRDLGIHPEGHRHELYDTLAVLTLACVFSSVSAAAEDAPAQLSLTPGLRVRVPAPGFLHAESSVLSIAWMISP
jgi:hypothetical protein